MTHRLKECTIGLSGDLSQSLTSTVRLHLLEPSFDLSLALHQASREKGQGVIESLRSDGIRLDRLLQLLAVVGKIVNIRGGQLAVIIGRLERIDLRNLEESFGRLIPGVDICRLRFAFSRLLRAVILKLGELVEDFRGDGRTVAAVLTSRHSLLRRDEAKEECQHIGRIWRSVFSHTWLASTGADPCQSPCRDVHTSLGFAWYAQT